MNQWKNFFLGLSLICCAGLEGASIELTATNKNIVVNGKEVDVLALTQPDGAFGLRLKKGDQFDVLLKNALEVPTSIHWHGLILPNPEDGVAFVTQFAVYPGTSYPYKFPLVQSGTFWMHSHVGLQEQRLLSAPLIIEEPDDKKIADQEVVIFLTDFSFKSPSEIFQMLRCNPMKGKMMSHEKMGQDLVDVDYDAFLTNYKTLENPDVVRVNPGSKVRLRIIDGSSSTNFFIHLGELKGELIAVDGNRVKPLQDSTFEVAVAQRLDIVVTIPQKGSVFPILAQGEGTDMQTGLILATGDKADIPGPSQKTTLKAGAFTNAQELKLRALQPLEKKSVDNRITLVLGGDMSEYTWTLNGQMWPEVTPVEVEKGQRVEIVFKNETTMSHPMHLHGHVFQVTAVNGQPIEGAVRDTVLVMPQQTVTIQFDADNPGVWPLHCHLLYHMEAGMFTVMRYKGYKQY